MSPPPHLQPSRVSAPQVPAVLLFTKLLINNRHHFRIQGHVYILPKVMI